MTSEPRGNAGDSAKLFRRVELRASAEVRDALYKSSLDSSHIDIEYVALLILSGLIALFGLLENSAAVIIGAMLISPLMNPILSAALALLLGDGHLGKRSATTLILSIAGVIGVTWFVAYLTPLKQATPEILARTSPNLLDLFIACLSGLAGTLALRGGSVAMTILPGVAIAVAVVPPLSVVGFGLSTHQGSIAAGAFLLFVTNLVSIIISAVAVFRIMGFQPGRKAEQSPWKFKYRMGISAIVLVLLSIPLFLTLRKAGIEVAVRSEVQGELKTAFETGKASISDLNFSALHDGLLIQTTLRTTQYVDTRAIQSVEDTLRKKFGPQTKLLVDQILVTQGGVTAAPTARVQNPIIGGVVKPAEDNTAFDFKAASLQSLDFVRKQVDELLAGTAVKQAASPDIILAPTPPLVLKLQLISSEPLNSQTISLLASQLAFKLGVAIQLHGQVELQGSPFQMASTPANPDLGLYADDRAAFAGIVKQAQANQLRLQVGYASSQKATGAPAIPPCVDYMKRILSKSGLQNSQWAIEAEPPAPGVEGAGASVGNVETNLPAMVARQSRCDIKSFQDF